MTWSMEKRGVKRVEVVGMVDKSDDGSVLWHYTRVFFPIQVIYAGKTQKCHPKFKFAFGWRITHLPKC